MKVQPIKNIEIINKIRSSLSHRDACLFTLGVNSAFRGSALLSIKIFDVINRKAGDSIELIESKTQKRRRVTLNESCIVYL